MLRHVFVKLLFFLSLYQINAQNLNQKPIPDWVEPTTPDYTASAEDAKASGFYYLLLDDQYNIEQKEYYERFTYKIVSKNGVQEMSDISIEFDPQYQKIVLHKLDIIRDGKTLNRLDLKDFRIIQREEDLERHLYNGVVTAVNHLYDIREGDIIDYAYTTLGRNPIHEGKVGATFFLQHTLPVAQIHISILKPENYDLFINTGNGAPDAKITSYKGNTRYSWSASDTKAILYESNTPSWYYPAPTVEFSAFENWAAVAKQYSKHYAVSEREKTALKEASASILKWHKNRSDSLTALLRFVQDDIRYLGFEDGLNSFKPSRPGEVLQRRFGDCKDKALLLSTLLQCYGVEAKPILVHSINGTTLDKKLPSPFVFDHCIVQYKTELGQDAYIDPTISDQGGSLQTTYWPNYHFGLVLDENTTELTRLTKAKKPKTVLTETFSLDKVGGGAVLDIETLYYDGDADDMRTYFNTTSTESVQKSYTDFYSSMYPGIRVNKEVVVEDDRKSNLIRVVENYKIDSLWKPTPENKKIIAAQFYPSALENVLYPVSSSERSMPYLTNAETNFEHKTVVYFPESWDIENESLHLDNPGFSYDYKIDYKNAALEITHHYKGKTDYLEADQVAKYLDLHNQIQNQSTYQLTYGAAFVDSPQISAGSYTLTISLIILGVLLSALLCWFLYTTYDLPNTFDERWQQPIGGWVAFFGIGIVLTPLIVMGTLLFSEDLHLNATHWEYLFDQSFLLGLIGIVELLYNSAYLIFSIFVAILYFQKRTIAPRMIIIMNAAVVILFTLDNIALLQLAPDEFNPAETQNIYGEILGVMIKAGIVICYFAFSERVKNTFTNTNKTYSEPEHYEFNTPEISPGQQSSL